MNKTFVVKVSNVLFYRITRKIRTELWIERPIVA